MFNKEDQLAIDTIRALSIDTIESQFRTPWFTNGCSTNGIHTMDKTPKF